MVAAKTEANIRAIRGVNRRRLDSVAMLTVEEAGVAMCEGQRLYNTASRQRLQQQDVNARKNDATLKSWASMFWHQSNSIGGHLQLMQQRIASPTTTTASSTNYAAAFPGDGRPPYPAFNCHTSLHQPPVFSFPLSIGAALIKSQIMERAVPQNNTTGRHHPLAAGNGSGPPAAEDSENWRHSSDVTAGDASTHDTEEVDGIDYPEDQLSQCSSPLSDDEQAARDVRRSQGDEHPGTIRADAICSVETQRPPNTEALHQQRRMPIIQTPTMSSLKFSIDAILSPNFSPSSSKWHSSFLQF